jgi:hypothetical protein
VGREARLGVVEVAEARAGGGTKCTVAWVDGTVGGLEWRSTEIPSVLRRFEGKGNLNRPGLTMSRAMTRVELPEQGRRRSDTRIHIISSLSFLFLSHPPKHVYARVLSVRGPRKAARNLVRPFACRRRTRAGPPAEDGKHGLRRVDKAVWEEMLEIVKCKVLSVIEGSEMDAYLLRSVTSPSSLHWRDRSYI